MSIVVVRAGVLGHWAGVSPGERAAALGLDVLDREVLDRANPGENVDSQRSSPLPGGHIGAKDKDECPECLYRNPSSCG